MRQAKKPFALLRCACGGRDFHYEYERNRYVCRACRRIVAGATKQRRKN